MNKIIHVSLTLEEFLPIKPLINAIPYRTLSTADHLKITSYLSAVAMLNGGILPEDMSKPKQLTNFKTDFDLRKMKFLHRATLSIEVPEEEKENDNDSTIPLSTRGTTNL